MRFAIPVRMAVSTLGLLALLLSPAGLVAGPTTGPSAESEEGFVSLFNGKDLAGWVYGKAGEGENKTGKGYQVRDGVLYSTRSDGGNLYTEKEYGDFVFRFEFRLTENANNGIAIRAPLEGDSAYAGMEIQVLDDSGSAYQKLRPSQYHGSIYDVVPARRGALRPVGEWNTEEITAKGRRITVKVNGQVVVDADLDGIKDENVLRKHPGLKRERGRIGFLGHGAHVEFRKMRIREL